jgi:hypothetical protein
MTKIRRYQLASSWILTEQIPDYFFKLKERYQNQYLEAHVTVKYELSEAEYIWEEIENLESLIQATLKEDSNESKRINRRT